MRFSPKLLTALLTILASSVLARVTAPGATDADIWCAGPTSFEDCVDKLGNMIPTTDNTHSLGTSALRWSNGYFGTGVLSSAGSIFSGAAANTGTVNYTLNSAGANVGQIYNSGTGVWSLGYGTSQTIAGTSVLTWGSSGNVAISTGYFQPLQMTLAQAVAASPVLGGVISCTNCTRPYTLLVGTGTAADQWREQGLTTGAQ